MKVFFAVNALFLSTMVPTVVGSGAETCGEQANCLQWSITENSDGCSGAACSYTVCMTYDDGALSSCLKTGDISHHCERPDGDGSVCSDGTLIGNLADDNKLMSNGESECFKVAPGTTVEFIVKDGQGCDGGGSAVVPFTGGSASCSPLNEAFTTHGASGTCTGPGNFNKECYWTVTVPSSCGGGGAGGDPHFKRWGRKSFEFHGECDLVLLTSDHVNENKQLDIHVRTTIHEWWSQIESAALKVGDVVLQMDATEFFINGVAHTDADLPLTTAEFTIDAPEYTGGANYFKEQNVEDGDVKTYNVRLNDKSVVTFKVVKDFMNVFVDGSVQDFGHATGLMGDFYEGKPYDRSGTRMRDLHAFALEWQVQPETDGLLFNTIRAPQAPLEGCRMPDEAMPARRRLKQDQALVAKAEHVCSGKDEYEACVQDVLATGDVALAHAHM